MKRETNLNLRDTAIRMRRKERAERALAAVAAATRVTRRNNKRFLK
jgi:hypothetical protein